MTEWISVTERLPEEWDFYRVKRQGQITSVKALYVPSANTWFLNISGHYHKVDNVTHWQPIEPPINLQIKGEDDGKAKREV